MVTMRRRKFLSIWVTASLFLFVGCSSKANSGKSLTVWHWMTDREPAFNELAKTYEAKTGLKVNFELYESGRGRAMSQLAGYLRDAR